METPIEVQAFCGFAVKTTCCSEYKEKVATDVLIRLHQAFVLDFDKSVTLLQWNRM